MLLLLLAFTQFSYLQFNAWDAGCWVTPSFYHSQPLVMNVNIPANYSAAELLLGRGNGNDDLVSVRKCAYTQCTNYVYYNAICPVIATLGFGTNNVTGLLDPGEYYLAFDSLHGFTSTQIGSAMLNVSIPSFQFTINEKQCQYGEVQINCSYGVTVKGTGTCFANREVNVSNESEPITSDTSFTNGSTYWNCSAGTYRVNYSLAPLVTNHFFEFIDSNLTLQTINETISITNPNPEDLNNVEVSAFGESRRINLFSESTVVFSNIVKLKAVLSNYSVSAAVYNYSSDGQLIVTVYAGTNYSSPFYFSTAQLVPQELNCENKNITLVKYSEVELVCNPPTSHSFSNWSAVNSTTLSVLLSITSEPPLPAQSIPMNVVNSSAFFSQLFSLPVVSNPNFFEYTSQTQLELSGNFIQENVSSEKQGEFEIRHYNLRFNNPTNNSFAITAALDLSNFDQIALAQSGVGFIPTCPAEICLEDKTLFVTVFNETNFNLKLLAIAQPTAMAPSLSVLAPSQAAGLQSLENASLSHENNSVSANYSSVTLPKFSLPSNSALANVALPSKLSGELVSSQSLLPFLFIPLLAAAFFFVPFVSRKKLVSRKQINNKTVIVVKNATKVKLSGLYLLEIIPVSSKVKSSAAKRKSVLGVALKWKKNSLKPGEAWQVEYSPIFKTASGQLSYLKGKTKITMRF